MTGELNINSVPLSGEALLLNQGGNSSAGGAVSRESVFYALISQSLAQAALVGQSQEQAVHISDTESDGMGKILWDLSGVKLGEMIPSGLNFSPPTEIEGENHAEEILNVPQGAPEVLAEELAAVMPEGLKADIAGIPINAVDYQEMAVERSVLPDGEKAVLSIRHNEHGGQMTAGKEPSAKTPGSGLSLVVGGKAPGMNSGNPGSAQLQNMGFEQPKEGDVKTKEIPVLTGRASEALPETGNSQKTATMPVARDAGKSESSEKAISSGTPEIAKNNLVKQAETVIGKDAETPGPTFQAAMGSQETETLKNPVKAAEIPEPYSQIGKEIQAKLQQKGPMEFTMQLEPKDLGKIDVRLKINDGKLIIDIMAASSKTHSLLTGQIDKLVMSMGLQNVRVENVQVSQQTDFSGSDKQEQSSFAGRENSYHQGSDRDNHSQHWRSGQNPQTFANSRIDRLGTEPNYEGSTRYVKAQKNSFTKMDYTI